MRNNHSSAAMSYRNVVTCNASSVMPRQSVISTAPRVCIIAVAMPSPIAVVVVATPQSPVVVTPVPPPAVGECREAIQVESVVVDIPEPRIGKCQYIKIGIFVHPQRPVHAVGNTHQPQHLTRSRLPCRGIR